MLAAMTSFLRGLAWCAPWVLVLACTSKPGAPPSTGDSKDRADGGGSKGDAPSLEGRVFLSQKVTEGGTPRPLVEGTQLSLSFDEQSRFGANAGCNSMSGGYSIEGGKLVITNAMQTEMACPGRLEQEGWYSKLLHASPSIMVDGDTLVLESGGVRIEYLDRTIATPDLELVGPTWTVDTIVTKDFASHAAWPKPATLVFGADGSLQVEAGCNGGRGTYRVSGTELTFESVGLTEMDCADPLANELETAVAKLLRGPEPVTFEITVDRLSLRGKEGGLDLVASTPTK